MGHPAKEGLRPVKIFIISIYTPQSGSSSKRGIKTRYNLGFPFLSLRPRVGHPAKEGLRPLSATLESSVPAPRVGHPAKEGLRQDRYLFNTTISLPRVGHPAKEGLRRRAN